MELEVNYLNNYFNLFGKLQKKFGKTEKKLFLCIVMRKL